MNLIRKALIAAVFIGVALVIAWAYRPAPALVSVATASRGPLQEVVEEDGRTRIRERYVVAAPVPGYMQRLALHVGDPVQRGQVLISVEALPMVALDTRARAEAQARVAQAAAALRASEVDAQAVAATAALAVREQARLRPLFDTGGVSKGQYDRAAAEADRASAALKSARAAIDVARYQKAAAEAALQYVAGDRRSGGQVAIVSPVNGVVLGVEQESEGVVSAGQALLTVGDPRSLELVTDVLSTDAVRIRPGMKVQVERWGGEGSLEARVRTVDPVAFTKISALGVEEQRVQVVSDLLTPSERWATLGDAYRVETRFVLWEADRVLRVPHSSLFRDGERWAVFEVDEQRIRRRHIQLGHRGMLFAEVLAGLDADARVVTYPDDQLADNAHVTIREQ